MSRTLFPQPESFIDAHGQTWRLLPDDAPYNRHEGAFLVAGVPVMVQGDYYLDETPHACGTGCSGAAWGGGCPPF